MVLSLSCLWIAAGLNGQSCNITNVVISNDQCLPGSSPVGFQINVSGTGTGTDFVVSSPDGSIPDPGPYDYAFGAFINLAPNDLNQPNYTFTVTDINDPSCSFTFTLPNPCITNCQITPSFNGNIICQDNGTPGDPGDDTFTIQVEVFGTGLGNNGWTATDPLSSSGPYNQIVTLGPYLISSGSFQITFQDVDNPSCQSVTLNIQPPPPCSNTICDLSVIGGAVICNDGGTPGDLSDDTFFQNIVVSNGGNSGNWVSTSPDNDSGIFGVSQTVGPFPSNGGQDLTFTITDANNPNCSIDYTIENPCPTVPACDLTNPGLGFTVCNDNGTPTDPSDDFYTFPLNPVGSGLGSGYTVSVSGGTVSPPGGNYGSETTFTLTGIGPPAGISVIVTDNDDPNCFTNTIINLPPPCSTAPACDINYAQIGNVTCSDNGTPNDPNDDTFTFILQVVGDGTSPNGWTANDPLGTTGDYNVVTTMGPYPISGGGFPVVVTDNDDPSCTTISVTIVPPAPCSTPPPCNLTGALINTLINCDDQGTSDPDDDVFIIELQPEGTNLSGTYTLVSSVGSITPAGPQPYGTFTTFELSISSTNGQLTTLTIVDTNDPSCTAEVISIIPASCSDQPPCDIEVTVTSPPVCSNNGTPNDPSDDTFTFNATISGTGTAGTWTTDDPNNTAGSYDISTLFGPYPISGGPLSITVTDAGDPNCTSLFVIPVPPTCSDICTITPVLNNLTCDDNGTPGNPNDDVFFANVTVNGTGGPSGWTVFPVFGPGIGAYGATADFGPIPISGGPVTLTFTDQNGPTCSADLTLAPPAPCSVEPCNLDLPTVITPVCDNGAIDFELLVNGTGTGTNYQVSAPGGVLTAGATGNYGQVSPFTLLPNNLSEDNFTLTITDSNDPTCSQTVSLDNPCDACLITAAAISNVQCADNGTPGDPTDDLITFSILADGVSTSGSYVVSAAGQNVQPSAGTFGSLSSFSLLPGSAGNGPVTLTLTDASDSNCTTTVQLNDAGTCSNACAINAFVTETTCIPAGVPEDDFFQATIQAINPVGTAGWTAQTPLGPVSGNYNQDIQLGPFLISQGSFSLTITDQLNPGCSTTLLVVPPDPCSVVCEADTTLIDLQSCNPLDTGTVVQNLTGQTGCDSIVITTTTLLPSDSTLLTQSSCNPADTGSVTQVLNNQFGCDSVVVINTLLVDSDTTLIDLQSCNPLDTGTLVQNLTGQTGCDSIVITTTTLLPSDTTLLFGESCNPADTGTVSQVLVNQFGCDSTVITTTTLLQSDTTLLFSESCNPADTGTVTQVLTNQFGCDSIVITTTTLLPSDTTLLFGESCNPADTGTVTQVLTNQFGCDSTVIITTTLLPSDTTLLFSESCNPADTGTVSQVLVNQFGCDSTVIITTTLLPRNTTVFFSQSCNPADTGTVTQILTNQFGCDSIVTTQVLLFSDPDYQLVADTLCAGESLVINGTVYDQERPIGQEVIQSLAEECDSVVIDIALVFAAPEAEIRPTNPACEGLTGFIEIGPPENGFPPYTITAAGQLLEDVSAFPVTIDVLAGDYTVELTDALGCTVSQPVSITEGISPALSIDGPLILEQGDTLTLRPMINFDPVTLEWRPAGQLSCSDCLNPVLEASESTTLLLTASLGNGCSATANVQVLVERQVDIYAPNIFSPNGDGRNDRFTLFSAPGQIDQIERMEIYDRWGNQVFAQTEFPANNVAVGWDGTFRGEPMGPGVFTYYAQVRLPTGRIILQKGDVTLIR
jgi:gliding motility-associated-like protein